MPNYDYAWRRYEELQKRAMNSLHVNNYSWGIESALSSLLNAIETGTVESDSATRDEAIDRIISSGARLQRSRSLTLKRWARPPESISTSVLAEANIELERIGRGLKERDQEILRETAYGYTDREIACRHASTPGAIRVRLSRLRTKLGAVNDSASRPANVKLTIRPRLSAAKNLRRRVSAAQPREDASIASAWTRRLFSMQNQSLGRHAAWPKQLTPFDFRPTASIHHQSWRSPTPVGEVTPHGLRQLRRRARRPL